MDRNRVVLDTTDTEGVEFTPGTLWAIGVDVFSSDVNIQWKSPANPAVWVTIQTLDEASLYVARTFGSGVYRCTTSSAGSRAWLILD